MTLTITTVMRRIRLAQRQERKFRLKISKGYDILHPDHNREAMMLNRSMGEYERNNGSHLEPKGVRLWANKQGRHPKF
jgi:hypothetical protein